jgi:D-serine deaminase-like pyridoxal phosphate-dependent protein
MSEKNYQYYLNALNNEKLPALVLDLDLFEENLEEVLKKANGKKIRIASKSIRSVDLIKKVLNKSPQFEGILCYCVDEALLLSEKGIDNLLVAYPGLQKDAIDKVVEKTKKGKLIVLMVDHIDQIKIISERAKALNGFVNVCLDIDMSWHLPFLNFGVYRSPLRKLKNVKDLYNRIKEFENIKIVGTMGYEAQIAGLGDSLKNNFLKSQIIRILKKISIPKIKKFREEISAFFEQEGISLLIKNGGGTGSLNTTSLEDAVNEVTMGSALYAPTLFDNYKDFKYKPSLFFALEVVRNPEGNIYTCNGGGYIASGAIGPEKLPSPFLPYGMELIKNEGAGEVQTPVKIFDVPIKLGQPIFFRHAKAGEVCERFKEIIILSKGSIIEKVKTYRGEGVCYF